MAVEKATAAFHAALRRSYISGWLSGALLPLLLSGLTAIALVPAMGGADGPPYHAALGLLTGLSFAVIEHAARWQQRRMLRSLPPVQLSSALEKKLRAALEPDSALSYQFTVHISQLPGVWLCEMDGHWRPQLYISTDLLEQWPVERLRARVGWLRQLLRDQRHWLRFFPAASAGKFIGVIAFLPLFMPLAGADSGFAAWQYPLIVLAVMALKAGLDFSGLNERTARALADRLELRRLEHSDDTFTAFVQGALTYDWVRLPAKQRERRTRARLNDMFGRGQTANAWYADLQQHLATQAARPAQS